jgi:hypothetical protein
MPHHVQIWIEDCDNGDFTVYMDEGLINLEGAHALQAILNATIAYWRRLDESAVRAALRVVTG